MLCKIHCHSDAAESNGRRNEVGACRRLVFRHDMHVKGPYFNSVEGCNSDHEPVTL